MNRHLPATVVAALKAWARRQPEIERLWAFGSRVRGWTKLGCCVRPDSDVDLALELSPTLAEPHDVWDLRAPTWRAELAALSPYKVDLQHLDEGSRYNRDYVNHSGVVIFERA